jgi:hypothetical protein
MARFRVQRTRRLNGTMGRGGVVVCMKWWQWWGCALIEHKARGGVWAESRNRAIVTWYRVHHAKRQQRMVYRGGVVAHIRLWWLWGGAFAQREAQSGFGPKAETEPSWLDFEAPCKMVIADGV